LNLLIRMNEKIIIKYLDKLVNEYIKDHFDEFMVIDFLKEDKEHLSERKDQAQSYKLADEIESFGLINEVFKVYEGHILNLDKKGRNLKDFKKGFVKFEKSLKRKPLDLYRAIPIGLSIIFFVLNFYQKNNYDNLKNQYDSLKTEHDSCKQKLSDLNNKTIEYKDKSLSATSQPKNPSDQKNE
jgi:hypothetical protein